MARRRVRARKLRVLRPPKMSGETSLRPTNQQPKNQRTQPLRRRRPEKPKSRETVKARKSAFLRAERIFSRLDAAYPDAKCALHFSNPLQLLVATILSAQSTDKMV